MLSIGLIFGISSKLGYLLPAVIGLESMGVPSPGETSLVAAAVLASQGKLQIWLVIVIGTASAIIGDNIGYLVARKIGQEVLEKPGPLYDRRKRLLAAGEEFFDKHGSKAVFLGRWVAILRIAAAWLAGINEMPFPRFFLWNALGGLTWTTTVGLIAYFAGSAAGKAINQFGIYAAIAVGIALVIAVAYRRRRKGRSAH